MTQKITPNLWFNGNAKDAVDYYVAAFPNSSIIATTYYPKNAEEGLADFQLDMAGKVLTIDFTIGDLTFTAINAGPEFQFNPAVSFSISCKDQAEIDYFWEKLSSSPEFEQCGWCTDKFGLSWQVVPENMGELMKKPGAYAAMMQMKKIIIDEF